MSTHDLDEAFQLRPPTPAAVLALVADAALGGLGKLLRPRGVGP